MERGLLRLTLVTDILAMDMVMARDLLKLNQAMDTLAMAIQIEDMAMDMAEDIDITEHILICDSRVQETSVVFN